ncbi:hypothetical protein CHS0354_007308 [Potamilus streckersoni]|uniref:Sulfotransferase domain-containing protein n=1 Tax=Potamilus streckersoni TaxID=2493646 RepID=A0AAE0TDA2_9BIVA|nr:hypothetical protein CHS0354_007308 [Potamilus streckersoni]
MPKKFHNSTLHPLRKIWFIASIMISCIFITICSLILGIQPGVYRAMEIKGFQDSEFSTLDLSDDTKPGNNSLLRARHGRYLHTLVPREETIISHAALKFMADKHLNANFTPVSELQKSDHRTFVDELNLTGEKRGEKLSKYPSSSGSFKRYNVTRRLPYAIIIGVKKGGTRALLEYLRLHPKIKATGPEPHFFDDNYEKGLEWYRQQMPSSRRDQLTIEKTPSYFVTKEIPDKVYKMSKRTKLIVVLRDPVTRAISDYAQLADRRPDVKSFVELAFIDNRTKIVDTSWAIIKIGIYIKHLVNWLEYFPLKQIHFVSGENLIKDPAHELRLVQEFLGLEPMIDNSYFTFNSTKGFPCFRKQVNSSHIHCLNRDKGRSHPAIDPSVIKRLRDFYKPFNSRLYQITGQNFGWT